MVSLPLLRTLRCHLLSQWLAPLGLPQGVIRSRFRGTAIGVNSGSGMAVGGRARLRGKVPERYRSLRSVTGVLGGVRSVQGPPWVSRHLPTGGQDTHTANLETAINRKGRVVIVSDRDINTAVKWAALHNGLYDQG